MAVESRLTARRLSWGDVSLVHLYVADMSHFAAVNEAYVRVVPTIRPPARACVQLPLPEGIPAALDVTVTLSPGSGNYNNNNTAATSALLRRSLHVQSISCWAPACIGPYGQAVSHRGLVHLAGCIGMDPATLDLVRPHVNGDSATDSADDSAAAADCAEARRSWRSAAAVARVMGCPLGRDTLAVTVYASSDAGVGGRRASEDAFEDILAGERWQDAVDIPGGPHAAVAGVPSGVRHDLLLIEEESRRQSDNGPHRESRRSDPGGGKDRDDDGNSGSDASDDDVDVDDDDGSVGGGTRGLGGDGSGVGPASPWPWLWRPLTTYVTVPRLPKGARVEVQPLLLDGDGPGRRRRVGAGGREEGGGEDVSRWVGDVEASREAVEERSHDVIIIGGNENNGQCKSLSRAGHFCRAHAAVATSSELVMDGEAAGAAVRAVVGALDAAGLSLIHVGSLRAYVRIPPPSSSSQSRVSTEWVEEVTRTLDGVVDEVCRASGVGCGGMSSSSSSLRCVVVPVLGASFGDVDDAALVLELTAVAG